MQDPHRPFARRCALIAFSLLATAPALADPLFLEDFEDGEIDARVSLTMVGGFGALPGVQATNSFGSANAFGFGRSLCQASCFDAHVTGFVIDLGTPTYVSTLSFKEMELYGNWGSGGAIFIDGVLLGTPYYDFGRLPYNDFIADPTYRSRSFTIDRVATTVELRVRDITYASEIFIDDVALSAVPEPGASALLLAGLAVVGVLATRRIRAAA